MRERDGGGAARLRAALAAVVAALALPAPAHADQWIDLYEWGVSQPRVEVEVGESVHFTNWSGLPTAIASGNGLFDSGELGPGAGYSVVMTVPGSHAYATAGLPDLGARIDVVLTELDGPADAPANEHIPRLAFLPPPELDLQLHPELAVEVSRSRILVGFRDDATVAAANDALDRAGVRIVGGRPSVDVLLVQTSASEDPFAALGEALAELRGDAAVEFAALSLGVDARVVPAASDALTRGFAGAPWEWDAFPVNAAGGNWGLERSRLPIVWNLREAIERQGHRSVTGIVDAGFDSHLDLPRMSLTPVCEPEDFLDEQRCSAVGVDTHGTHVAGIVGADHDGASPREPGRTRGVAGVDPGGEIRAVNYTFGGANEAWAETLAIFDLLLDEAEGGLPLRSINFSMGPGFSTEHAAPPFAHLRRVTDWWDKHPDPRCGPGTADDDTSAATQFCTPNNDDVWLREMAEVGRSAARVARRAAALGVLITEASGNNGLDFCVPAAGTADFLSTLVNTNTGACHVTTSTPLAVDGDAVSIFAAASRNWLGPIEDPIIVVDDLTPALGRAPTSNVGGDVAAPGTGILSTYPANNYEVAGGTSMAAPFVAGLVSYLLSFDPTLTVGEVREKLETWAATDVTSGSPRVDAYATLMSLPEAHKAMVDVNDPSADGNRRVVLERGNVEGEVDIVQSTTFGHFTEPDGHVDMRDFRRFRDAYILDSLGGTGLNGGEDHPKRDLNFDGCVYWGADNFDCLQGESTYPRFDFNGSGGIDRFADAPVPTESGPVPMTDLRVMARQWDDDLVRTEGWGAADLERLYPESGDLEVHADALFDSGASTVELSFRNPDTGETYPSRTLADADEFLVATVPSGRVEIAASASTPSETLAAETVVELVAGEDERVDLCIQDLVLSAGRTTVVAGATTPVLATFDDCEGGELSGRTVSFGVLPIEPDGASVSPETDVTDADGHATSTFDAGDRVGVYTVSASLDLGDGRTLEDELQIEVVPALKVAYAWRQEILEWSEGGSSRWGPPLDPLMPDCVNAGVPYCIDDFDLAPAAPFNPLEREGVISGLGNALRLTEEVAPSPNSSRQTWSLTDPDGSNPRSDDAVVQWRVADDQLHRYTDFALPDTVRTRDDEDGIRLFGLRAVAGLGYLHEASYVDPPAGTSPVELWFTSGRMLLQPRGDGSALQYAPVTTRPILFPRQPDGTFAPYTYCQTVTYDLTSQRGYWDPTSSEWIRGATDQGRKTTFTPGDRPMPVGAGTLTVRYAFGAVAAYGADDPAAVAPACDATGPPEASFAVDGSFEEGRMNVFRSTSTDPENDIVAWRWDFGDGTVVEGAPNTFGLQAHLFKDDGFYEVSLTVVDSEGHEDTATRTVTVTNLPPEATFEDATGVEGVPVDVPFSVWDPSEADSRALEVEITLAGLPTPLLSTTREAGFSTFRVSGLAEGTHTLTLRVEDPDGASATDTATVTVLPSGSELPPPPPPPDPTPTCDPTVLLDAEERLFAGLLNAYRAQNGLEAVDVSPRLTRAAERHANDMATNDNFSHTGTDGSTPFQRAMDAGYPGESVSENIFFGSPRAQDALLGWKSSTTGHNENMLQPDWHAVGIARQFGSGKWFWATSYGDVLDCPGAGEAASGVVEATVTSDAPRTLAATEAVLDEEPTPLPYDPLAAFTLSNAQPRENAPVTVVNRSRDASGSPIAATLEYGDGLLVELAADASAVVRLPGQSQELRLTAVDANGGESDVARQLWVEPLRPPTIDYLGETLAAVGKTLEVSARLRSPWDDALLPGIPVTFTLGAATASGTTGADGIASATLDLTGTTAGSQFLRIETAAGEDVAAGRRDVFLTLILNSAPVSRPGGPYTIGDGGTLLLDGGLSTDETPGDLDSLQFHWDLDGDGEFDDATGDTPPELAWAQVEALVCAGTCAAGTPYPVALRVTDRWGDSHTAATTVTVTADFGLVLGGGTITIVPGASNSVAVHVVGSSSWTEPVTLSATGLPDGVTATFSKNPVTPTDTSVLTLAASASAANGSFPLRVVGTGGGLTRETGEEVTVAFGLIPICFGTIGGTVLDVTTGAPVPDVPVRFVGISGGANTDEHGRYVIRNVPLGFNNAPRTHSVRTQHTGYWEQTKSALAVCRGVTRLDFEILAKQTGRVTGTVVDRETRLPLAGARLSGFDAPTVFTDAEGRYGADFQLFPNNQPRTYTYRAEATGYWPQDRTVTVDAAVPQVRDFDLLRKCQGTIRGGVVRIRQTGAVAAGAVVRLQLGPFSFVSTTTDAEGRYAFDRLVDLGPENTPIGYSVQAFPPAGSPPGSTSAFGTFLLNACGAEATADIEIGIPVENRATIQGTVRDEETLEPLAGANVRLCGATCLEKPTGADGTYRFENVHVGYDSQTSRFFTVQASKTGWYTSSPPGQTVTAGTTATLDVALLRQRFGRLEGTVTDILSGAPIPDASIQELPFGCFAATICTLTDREGRYVDDTVPLGTRNAPFSRTFSVSATGYWPTNRAALFTADTTNVVDVQLLKECPAARVVGTVVNAETQAPILGATVSGGGRSTSTDAAGRFTLTGLRAGSGNNPVGVSITASAPGFFSQTKFITIFCGATIVVDFGSRETALGTIVGTVTNADAGTPLEDVLVGSEFGQTAFTDASGSYRFDDVPLGDLNADRAWKVTAFADGFKPQTKTVVAKANVEVRADFSFSVLGNSRPVADALTVGATEDTDAVFALTGSDADDDPLTFHVMRYPAHGRLLGTAPDVRYLPDRDFNGVDTFEFLVNDGQDNSERATVTLDVQPVNDPPAGFQDLFETGVDVPLEIPHAGLLANDVDPDGDALTVTNVFPGALFQVDAEAGLVRVTPPAGFESATHVFAFNYLLADPSGATSFGSAYVRVTRQPLAPACADAAFETDVDTPLDASVSCTDGNGDPLTYALVSGPSSGFLVFEADGTFTFTPAPGFSGTATFTFRASDGTLTSAPATASILVASDNAPPVAPDVSVATDEDVPLGIDLAATDPDGDAVTITHGAPAHGTFDGTTYTPAADFSGSDSFTYTADDGNGGTDTGTVAIEVAPVNDPPVAMDGSAATAEDTPVAITLASSDVDGGAPSFALATPPEHGTWDGATYTPDSDFHGADSFEFVVSDGAGGTDTGTVSIAVTPVNDAPVATDAAVAVDEDGSLAVVFAGTDVDGDPLSFAPASAPEHGSFDGTAYRPAANYHGPDSLAFVASDGKGGSDTGTVSITVRPVNDPPQVSDVAVSTPQDTAVAIPLAGTDADGDVLTITTTAPAHGVYAGGVYTPAPGFQGEDSFTYTAADGHGGSDTATVTVTVTPTGIDASAPTCTILGHELLGTGRRVVHLALADAGFGLAGHTVLHERNATFEAAYEPGARAVDALVVATDPAKSLAFELELRDLAGNVARCDPLALVVGDGKQQDLDFFRVPAERSLVTVRNGDPGLRSVQLIVSRRRLPEIALAPGETRTIDIAAALRPGAGNTVTVRARGDRGTLALISLGEGPG